MNKMNEDIHEVLGDSVIMVGMSQVNQMCIHRSRTIKALLS